jgi:hypothetical protein
MNFPDKFREHFYKNLIFADHQVVMADDENTMQRALYGL